MGVIPLECVSSSEVMGLALGAGLSAGFGAPGLVSVGVPKC